MSRNLWVSKRFSIGAIHIQPFQGFNPIFALFHKISEIKRSVATSNSNPSVSALPKALINADPIIAPLLKAVGRGAVSTRDDVEA